MAATPAFLTAKPQFTLSEAFRKTTDEDGEERSLLPSVESERDHGSLGRCFGPRCGPVMSAMALW